MGITLATFSVNFLFNIDTAYKFFNRIRAGVSLVSIGTQLCCYIRSIFPTTTCAFKFAFITKNFACTIAGNLKFCRIWKKIAVHDCSTSIPRNFPEVFCLSY